MQETENSCSLQGGELNDKGIEITGNLFPYTDIIYYKIKFLKINKNWVVEKSLYTKLLQKLSCIEQRNEVIVEREHAVKKECF